MDSATALRSAQNDVVGAQNDVVGAQNDVVGAQKDGVGAQNIGGGVIPRVVAESTNPVRARVKGLDSATALRSAQNDIGSTQNDVVGAQNDESRCAEHRGWRHSARSRGIHKSGTGPG